MKMNYDQYEYPVFSRGDGSAPFATSYMVGREDKRMKNRTMLSALNAAAGYQDSL